MTRETKIGLLVGLAFIIVIGILLSDHIQSSTEPPPAKLADAGKTAQQAVNTLGASNAAPPVTIVTPTTVAPQQTVPTTGDLNPRPQQPVTSVVSIGSSTQSQPPVTIITDQQRSSSPAVPTQASSTPATPVQVASADHHAQSHQSAGADAPDVAPTPAGGLRELARQNSADLVPVGPGGSTVLTSTASGKSYKAEAGDTVSKMALKFFGANTKTNRDAIVKANPTLHDNPDKVIVGKTYAIPNEATPASSAAVASATETPAALKPGPAAETPAPSTPTAAGTEYWYTVKQGDSLWRIATEQCGNAGAVPAIKELNKDALKGTEIVKVDMKLRLPSRPVASAN
jgi:nucleoid-associated protein YgaU